MKCLDICRFTLFMVIFTYFVWANFPYFVLGIAMIAMVLLVAMALSIPGSYP